MTIQLTYLAHEKDYRQLVSNFLCGLLKPKDFICQYFILWSADRDAQINQIEQEILIEQQEQIFCGFLNEIFTSCDCYAESPDGLYDISETQLRDEVACVAKRIWPNITASDTKKLINPSVEQVTTSNATVDLSRSEGSKLFKSKKKRANEIQSAIRCILIKD